MNSLLMSLGFLLTLLTAAHSAINVDIYWSKSNEIFQTSNDEHILELALKDQLIFHCPHSGDSPTDEEYYVIYRVPKMYYDSCSLPPEVENRKLKKLGISRVTTCRDPSKKRFFGIVLDQFSALPGSHGGLTFQPGSTYYFISTSSGTLQGLDNKDPLDSSCLNDNMRLELKVAYNQGDRPMRQYPTPERQTTPTATRSLYNAYRSTSAGHVRRHNNGARLPNAVNAIADYSVLQELTTTAFKRPKYPQAIINAEVTLDTYTSSACTRGYHMLVIVLSLLHTLLRLHSSLR